MATKANPSRKANLQFSVSGSGVTTVFSAVRNWTVRVERDTIEATNNDSLAWRELVVPPSTSALDRRKAGQLGGTITAEAIYDVNPLGPLGASSRSQAYDRYQVMRHLVDGVALSGLQFRLGSDPTVPASTAWAEIGSVALTVGFVESVEVGGTYDDPVLYDITLRYSRAISGI